VLIGTAKEALRSKVSFKIPDRFLQTGPKRLAPRVVPPALPAPQTTPTPAIAPRIGPRRRK